MRTRVLFVSLLIWLITAAVCPAATTFTDMAGNRVVLERPPQKVVSLIPAVTETIVAVGAADALCGITYHDADLPGMAGKPLVGGFFEPSLAAIKALSPDLIFAADLHTQVKNAFANTTCPVITLGRGSLADRLDAIEKLGRLFDKTDNARAITRSIQSDLALIKQKTAKIPPSQQKRVIRLMGRKTVMTPGTGTFQAEMIRAAGGIVHDFPQEGQVIPVSRDAWADFNPQVIYGCGGDRKTAESFFNQSGWKDVDAVKHHQIYYFPCDLTCRAATNTGRFISWLAARIYHGEFAEEGNLVLPEQVTGQSPVTRHPAYVKNATVATSRIYDFINKTLILDLNSPMTLLSTLTGWQTGIQTVGNHYASPPCWAVAHADALGTFQKRVCRIINRDEKVTSLLFTGADMDNLAIGEQSYADTAVWAYVTAGVESNALRMGKDTGGFYEPGTINIILMANRAFSRRAMTRAVITATEAKTAALLDMDIRSSRASGGYRATGTGTDNIIVVQGKGSPADKTGGHSKIGELIARAVYEGVQSAVRRQNHLAPERTVFQRLEERDITIFSLIGQKTCDCGRSSSELAGAAEQLLLDPVYANFIELALAVSDDYEKGLITDLTAFHQLADEMAASIAGKPVDTGSKSLVIRDDIPTVIQTALNAILVGVSETDI
ncbi:MAG: adenosylcobinamide amidohydrolase [Thermodesulfobacteriota bacterium]|nr:adenosylcobinamide amidohydrolase [Thermodesulfobacteriota bacterium]